MFGPVAMPLSLSHTYTQGQREPIHLGLRFPLFAVVHGVKTAVERRGTETDGVSAAHPFGLNDH